MPHKKLPITYFQSEDTLEISRDLIGKFLVSNVENKITSGMIIETEAYLGADDRACHSYGNRRTKRTDVMYLPGGHCYVYLCYGIHYLFNIVTHKEDTPHAILIRALLPFDGIDTMLKRRGLKEKTPKLTAGPGTLSKALGITSAMSGEKLGKTVWVEDRGISFPDDQLITSPRVGVAYAKEHALLPYRFTLNPTC